MGTRDEKDVSSLLSLRSEIFEHLITIRKACRVRFYTLGKAVSEPRLATEKPDRKDQKREGSQFD
jgi:hypothetical protein